MKQVLLIIIAAVLFSAATTTGVQEVKFAQPSLQYLEIYYNHNLATQDMEKKSIKGWRVKQITGDERNGILIHYVKY